ncbi:hypothetical protein M1M07_18790 [Rhodococcus sp. HM1]|uniref:hypothetical protein n=1 Tax=unclassified Rhodococcus (in: high G+C Gram-positive bacteria) TaxID=192944 RepID=UPI00200A2E7A|nr:MULTISPECIES: hypothetical protein [unclassified Rhodococcus (in: high G+C Gram-positive bacteria)]MCK8673149.1 hypothetical protein [Rhodococcus sp. HM1]
MTVERQKQHDDTDRVRAVADTILYEGYLLYPYRANARKNHSRWQFGVLGPPGAAASGLGEPPGLAAQTVLRTLGTEPVIEVTLRFLQLQRRTVQRRTGEGFEIVPELVVVGQSWVGWDEAVECSCAFSVAVATENAHGATEVAVPAGEDTELLTEPDGTVAGRLLRTRRAVHATVTVEAGPIDGDLVRVSATVTNTGDAPVDADDAIGRSLIGAHLILAATEARFVSLLEPPADAAALVGTCTHERCFPVLAGDPDPAVPGEAPVVLVSPIILYDHPRVAEQSGGDLFDATEIDEILTLRVLTLTDEEKAQARATDARAAEIVDRCEAMTPEELQALHGVLRDPGRGADPMGAGPIPEVPDGVDWWTEEADTSVRPELDTVLVQGMPVGQGSLVRLHPSRRADAQDLFFRDRLARVATVHADVDGGTHVGVVLTDDPAADLHEWFGRYLYFAPDEIEPVPDVPVQPSRNEES